MFMSLSLDKVRKKFYNAFEKLPEKEIDQPIVQVDEEWYTWRNAKIEIDKKTDTAKKY